MTIRLFVGIVLCSTAVLSCKTAKDSIQKTVNVEDVTVNKDDLIFQLKKGACYGSCPHYEFNIYNNMYAEFIGARNTDKIGTYAKFITKEEVRDLVSKFDKANFHSLNDNYPSNIADLPIIIISYNKEAVLKTVAGKRERPEAVHKLQFLLEKIAEHQKEGWTKISDNTGIKNEVKINKSQIVVDIARGNELARWFDKMKTQFGFQIVERLKNDSSSWLITYNTKNHTPGEVIKYLQSDPVVHSAEFKKEY